MDLAHGLGHLTYCTNIHAAEHWPDVERGLREHLPSIKAQFAPDAPMGVGIRLAASAARALADPEPMQALVDLLGRDFYVFTVNGFPYGTFHGERVKDGAYRPDWSRPERLTYTNLLADHLARLLPEGLAGTISTVPCTYKPWLTGGGADAPSTARIVDHLLQHVAHLLETERRTGASIMLTLEPEPFCLLETIEETVAFFEAHLLGREACSRLAALTGTSAAQAERALRRHLGVCYDVCHAAVEFENPAASVERLRSAGIAIGKVQLSSALRIDPVTSEAVDALRAFDEPVYLHQTIERRNGELVRYADLGDAFAALPAAEGSQWRSHFHVPVFLERMQHFDTTQAFLREILSLHRTRPLSDHLEVETYTWDVLPPEYRRLDLSSAIARELNWVLDTLGLSTPAAAPASVRA